MGGIIHSRELDALLERPKVGRLIEVFLFATGHFLTSKW